MNSCAVLLKFDYLLPPLTHCLAGLCLKVDEAAEKLKQERVAAYQEKLAKSAFNFIKLHAIECTAFVMSHQTLLSRI